MDLTPFIPLCCIAFFQPPLKQNFTNTQSSFWQGHVKPFPAISGKRAWMLEEAWHFSGLSYPELLWHNIRETETFRFLIVHSHWHEVGLGYCWLQSAQNYIYYLILISLFFLMIVLYQERITSPSGSSSFFLKPLQYSGFSALGWQLPTCSEWHKSPFYLICIFSNKKKAHFSS